MPARIRKSHQDDIRAKIQADRLIAWLQAGVFESQFQGKKVVLDKDSGPRVRAALGLLSKSVPDLQRTELQGEGMASGFALVVTPLQAKK